MIDPMKNASGGAVDDAPAALHVFHRDEVTRSPWDGPAATAGKGDETTSVMQTVEQSPRARSTRALRFADALLFVRFPGY